MDQILANAIASIEVGIEDFRDGSDRRLVSSVRNVYAGLLLLAKTVLWQESPNGDGSLIFIMKRHKDGTVHNTGKTLDVRGIQDGFDLVGLAPDWGPLNAIQGYRNDIEHLYSSADPNVVKEQLGRTLPLIQTLMGEYLEIDPQTKFSPECWQTLLETKEFFDEVQAACLATFAGMVWKSTEVPFPSTDMHCSSCGSHLIAQQHTGQTNPQHMHLICRNCGEVQDLEDTLEAALVDSTAGASFLAVKDGDRAPLDTCPNCSRETFVIDIGECVLCDFEIEAECAICGEPLDVTDYSPEYPGLCAYHAHVVSKAD
jgi:DNA-directed RNA polymerase subunit M/transcription elongation factor TFIIS